MQTPITRLAAIALAAAMFSGVAQAQTPMGGMDVGVTAGVNISTVSGDDVDDASNLVGFMGGLSLNFPISDMLSFQPEILYSQKGTKLRFEGMEGEIRLNYIDIPLLVKFATGGPTQMRPTVFVGPSIGFRVGCTIKALGESFDCSDEDIELEVKKTDFGVVFGLGLDIGNFGVFARFQQGLTSLDDSGDNDKVYNRVITLGGRMSLQGLRR